MKLLLQLNQRVMINDNIPATVSSITETILDLKGDFSRHHFCVSDYVSVNGIRFLIIGSEPNYLDLEITGDMEMGYV